MAHNFAPSSSLLEDCSFQSSRNILNYSYYSFLYFSSSPIDILEHLEQADELRVLGVADKCRHRHCVVGLENVRVWAVVHDDHFREVPAQTQQILDVGACDA